MKKTLAILSDSEPELTRLSEEIKAVYAKGTEQEAFLRKRAEMMEKAINEEAQALWRRVEQICKDRGWIPENYKTGMGSFLTFEAGALTYSEGKNALVDHMRGLAEEAMRAHQAAGGGLEGLIAGVELIRAKASVLNPDSPSGDNPS